MRIGFVVEGSSEESGDVHAIRALCARFVAEHNLVRDPIVVAGGSKSNIIQDAHKHVPALLSKGCSRVILVWDNCPPWSGDLDLDQFECGLAIRASLRAHGISTRDVRLVCSKREIEAWLLTDDRIIRDVLGTVGRGAMPGISGTNQPETVSKPKERLHDWWYQRCKRPPFGSEYGEMFQGARLAKLRKSKTFVRLEDRVV